MKAEGINLENVKTSNRASVLRLLNKAGAMSRKDLAAQVGLTAAAMTLICSELIEEGILIELGEIDEGEKRAGRKKKFVDINPNYRDVICISIEADMTFISITDFCGNVLASKNIDTDSSVLPEKFLGAISDIVKSMLWELNVDKSKILGAGVTLPGKVDRRIGNAISAYGIWNQSVDVKTILSNQLGVYVIVENNVRAYAESELIYGEGRNLEDFLLVKWGPGVGSAIISGGKIFEGANAQAAEIGHVTVYKDGNLCSCGKRGCLETGISKHAIREEVNRAIAEGKMKSLKSWLDNQKLSLDNIKTSTWALVADEELQVLLTQKIDDLALVVENMACMLDPSKIVLFGGMFEIEGFYDKFKECFKKYNPGIADDYIIISELGDRIYSTGPMSLVMNEKIFNN